MGGRIWQSEKEENGPSAWRRWRQLRSPAQWAGTRCGPLVMAESTPVYAQYTVETGDIETSMSLSGVIELVNSESFSASERTTVQEVYVEADQTVSAGDELLRLSNGETFTATIDGTVTTLNVSTGDAVWPQMSLATVADLSDLRVSTSVDEYDVKTVEAGQQCSVTVVSLGLTFETEIDHVDRVSASAGAVASYHGNCRHRRAGECAAWHAGHGNHPPAKASQARTCCPWRP